jgi:hypothetical protein
MFNSEAFGNWFMASTVGRCKADMIFWRTGRDWKSLRTSSPRSTLSKLFDNHANGAIKHKARPREPDPDPAPAIQGCDM